MGGLIVGCILIFSVILTAIVRFVALKLDWIDKPNERSAHRESIPTSGGIAIVISFFVGLLALYFTNNISNELFLPLFIGGGLIALVGFIDDIKNLKVNYRIIVHFIAAIFTVSLLGDFGGINIFGYTITSTIFGFIISVLLLIGWINAYNFMDGIDSLAALEAIFVSIAAVFLMFSKGNIADSVYLSLLAVSVMGFLVFNWPPAQIFMGDIGSTFLGFILGVFIIYTTNTDKLSIWTWLILLAVFFVDVIYTISVRVITKQNITRAHKNHCYQKITAILSKNHDKEYVHKTVAWGVISINLIYLLPLAYLSEKYPDFSIILWIMSAIPLILISLKFKAGRV